MLMTADDLLCLPDDGQQYELVRGRLICVAPASSRSSIVSRRAGTRIDHHVGEHDLGVCGDSDWGFKLQSNPDTVRAPDVSVVLRHRIPTEGLPPGFWPGAPDLAVEVLSPSNRWPDVLTKVKEYLDAGTKLVWVLDPEVRRATVFHPDALPETAGADGELSGEDVLPGFTLRLSEIWVSRRATGGRAG